MADDSDPGIGVGYPITGPAPGVPLASIQETLCTAVPLWRYAQRIRYPEDQFFGVLNETTIENYQCREMWSQLERTDIAYYLREAQRTLEDYLGYFLCPTWSYGTLSEIPNYDDRYLDQRIYRSKMTTRWAHVIQAGTLAVASVSAGEVVDHSSDPAVVGGIATTLTDQAEIRVFHPGSDLEISPSSVVISGGVLTIRIPRARMVKESLMDTPSQGLDYADTSNFEATVDVYRIYNDPSKNAVIVAPHSCSPGCFSTGCGEYTNTGCLYIKRPIIGTVQVQPATYSGGEWTSGSLSCRSGDQVRLYYQSGLRYLPEQLEDAVVRLAHSLMAEEPCGCQVTQRIWQRDRTVPGAITRERAHAPFGLSDGAWRAFVVASQMRVGRSSVL